jgi:large subunit ribosomal protein L14e
MGEAHVTASQWRLVEVGRVVLFTSGKYEGRLAAIAEIIDHKRVRIPWISIGWEEREKT